MGSQELVSYSSKKKKPAACSSHDNLFLSTEIHQENHSTLRDPKGKKPMNHSVASNSSSMVIQASSGSSIPTEVQETETDSAIRRSLKGKKLIINPPPEHKESEAKIMLKMSPKRKQSSTQTDFSTNHSSIQHVSLTQPSKKYYPNNELSRKLTLGHHEYSSIFKTTNRDYLSAQEQRIKNFGFYSPEDVEEERRLGVCTQLKLYENPWKITKKLKLSDVNGSARLLLGKDVVGEQIIHFWDTERVSRIESENGVRVRVWDCDTKTEHELVFKRWFKSSHSFVFNNEWSSQFVRRRGLKVDDEIGLFWDTNTSRFFFRVLVRSCSPGSTTQTLKFF